MVKAQEWLDQNYPKEKRRKITKLEINNSYLEGSLDLTDFKNLEKLECIGNQLTNLVLWNPSKIYALYCYENYINNFHFLNDLDSKKLEEISISNNDLPKSDLSIFSRFTNLKYLFIGNINLEKVFLRKLYFWWYKGININKKIDKEGREICNRFYGGLEPLMRLNKLECLDISGTDIDNGLEYLPNNIGKSTDISGNWAFYCSVDSRKESKVKTIETELRKFDNESIYLDFNKALRKWKNDNKPTFERKLGRGSFGEVWCGKWKGKEVAVKKFFLSIENISEKDIKNIKKEIEIIKKLKNENIIEYYGVHCENNEVSIIMDYAKLGTLTKFINDNSNQKNQDWEINIKLIREMTKGLIYIHGENIIHRDLKSLNILLTINNSIKISDFGLSKTKISSSTSSKASVVGTLRWMAPENIKEGKYSEKSDIYSLGMIIWEIVSRCTIPFKDLDQNQVLYKLSNNCKEKIPSNIPVVIKEIINSCWHIEPEQRISLQEISNLLDNNSYQEYQEFTDY